MNPMYWLVFTFPIIGFVSGFIGGWVYDWTVTRKRRKKK